MATYEELLEAAGRAHKAGDAKNARILVQEAQKMKGGAPKAPQALAATPPRVDDPTSATARPDRFGDTIAAATEGPRQSLSAFAGGLADQSQSPTMAALPEDMNPRVKGVVAGLGDLAGVTASTLGIGIGGAAGVIGETFGGSPTNELKLARDLTMAGQVAVPELAGVSSAARIATKAPTVAQEAAQAAKSIGVTPSLSMTGKTGAMAAAGLEKVPLTGGVIAKDAARAVAEVEAATSKAVSLVGNASGAEKAGSSLQAGLVKFVDNFKTKAGEMFEAVGKQLPAQTRLQLTNTQKALDDTKALFAGNEALAKKLGLSEWDAVMAEAKANGISWGAVKKLRTDIGEAIGTNRGTLADEDVGRLKQLYGALTQDMEDAAKSAGPEAYASWRRANKYYKAGADRIEGALDKTIKADSPERAFEAFANMAKADRSTSDITRVRRIRASMSRKEWDNVAASIVDRLGKSPAGQQGAAGDTFSPGVFLTEWNKLDKEAKRLLLPDDARAEFEKIARVAEKVKAGNLERNMSNTGTAGGWLAVVFGSAADLGMTATALGGSYISAKALTSPMFLRAMNNAARGEMGAVAAMARGKGPFAQDARTIMTLTGADAAAQPAANTPAAPLQLAR